MLSTVQAYINALQTLLHRRSLQAVTVSALLLLSFSLSACDSTDNDDPEQDIVEVAIANDFDTLVAAVQAADLVATLKGNGPFTVFAPTDEAFAKLPAGTVETLLLPENKDQLVAILAYHVVPARVSAAEVVNLETAMTLQGAALDIETENGIVRINDATVTATDIEATNGIVHVIDTVLLPPSN